MRLCAVFWGRCLFCFFLGIACLVPSRAEALSVEWKHPPTLLIRGRHFVWQGQIKGISPRLLQKGVHISFALLLPSRTIRLGEVPVNNQGQFLFEGVVSHQLSPQPYQLDVRVLVPQPSRPKTVVSPNTDSLPDTPPRRSSRSQTSGRRSNPQSPHATVPTPNPKTLTKTLTPEANRSTGQPKDVPSTLAKNSARTTEPLSRTQEHSLQELKKGWKAEESPTPATRSWFLPSPQKPPSFLLPPISSDADTRQSKPFSDSKTNLSSSTKHTHPNRVPDGNPNGNQTQQRSSDHVGATRFPVESKDSMEKRSNRSAFPEQQANGRGADPGRKPTRTPTRTPTEWGKATESRGRTESTDSVPGRVSRTPVESGQDTQTGRDNPAGEEAAPPTQPPSPQHEPPSSHTGSPSAQGNRTGSSESPNGVSSASGQPTSPPKDQPPTMVPPVPSFPSQRSRKKPVHSHRDSVVWSRASTSSLDLNTDMGHTYLRQVFDPYIPHLQRISVLQKVRSDFSLAQEKGIKVLLPVGGRRHNQRAYFVGRIRVVLWRKRWTPIPSVSPEARILWYRTQPPTALEFAKDSNDLFYVRAKRWKTALVFLEFGTDGSRDYFGGEIPRDIRASRYQADVKPWVPRNVQRVAWRHLREFGLEPEMTLREILYRIVPYLRSFVARKLQPKELRANVFSTLWSSRVGVCRHRATLFVMALQSMGFPARMVANQAHAFAEVQYPDGQWRQIDLGGGEIPHWMGSWQGRRFSKPEDPFPTPPPNPHQAAKPPVTPHPPPYDPSMDETSRQRKQMQAVQESDHQGATPSGSPSGRAKRQQRGRQTRSIIRRVRKIRKPYLPHTQF